MLEVGGYSAGTVRALHLGRGLCSRTLVFNSMRRCFVLGRGVFSSCSVLGLPGSLGLSEQGLPTGELPADRHLLPIQATQGHTQATSHAVCTPCWPCFGV